MRVECEELVELQPRLETAVIDVRQLAVAVNALSPFAHATAFNIVEL